MSDTKTLPLEKFQAMAAIRPDAPALVFEGRAMSYGALEALSTRCAQALLSSGVKPGDRVCVMAKNNDVFFVLLLGAMKARACLTPINWRLAVPEVAFVLKDSGATIVVHSREYEEAVRAATAINARSVSFVCFDDGETQSIRFDDWLAPHPSHAPQIAPKVEDDLIQLYTSGTTGFPKGVQLTQGNYGAFVDSAISAGWARWDEGKTSLLTSPLFHVAGVNVGMISLLQGVRTVIVRDADPAELVRLICDERIAYVFLVPTLINMMLQTEACAGADFSALERICYGASPISDDVLRKAIARFQCKFSQLYGLTETTGGGTELAHEDHKGELLRSCGKAIPGFEVRVVDGNGNPAATGAVGEIQIRAKGVMRGYWNRADATAAAIDDKGWFKTGDAGFMNDAGYLFIHDRMKDMIVSGGENIYPAEVENAIFGHPDVADAAVIGVPDEKWGEAVKAIIVPRPGATPSAESIIAHARERIASYKVPKSVDFVDVLPRNPSGKVLRRELRERYWKGRDRRVA